MSELETAVQQWLDEVVIGLHNEIAHRAIHLCVVLGLCFLVFPRPKRMGGPWEWIVSIGLVVFYLLLGVGLLRELNDPVSTGAQVAWYKA